MRILLRQLLDVNKDAAVDAVHDGIGPQSPICSRPHFVLIGGRSLKARAAIRQRDQHKIGAFRLKIVVFQMPHMDVPVGRSLLHQERLFGHGKRKMFSRFPRQNRFLEASSREAALAVGGQALPFQSRFDGIRNSQTKWPLVGLCQWREGDDSLPDDLGRCRNLDAGAHLIARYGWWCEMLRSHHGGESENQHGKRRVRRPLHGWVIVDGVGQESSEAGERPRDRGSHGQAD